MFVSSLAMVAPCSWIQHLNCQPLFWGVPTVVLNVIAVPVVATNLHISNLMIGCYDTHRLIYLPIRGEGNYCFPI